MELILSLLKYSWDFIRFTAKDFQWVWRNAPNVLIWCAVLGLILFFM